MTNKPVMIVFVLVILIVTSQFEWRQPPLDSSSSSSSSLSEKQQLISDKEESVKEKIIISQERHIHRLSEAVRSLQLQLLQCNGENETRNVTKSKQFIEEVERKPIMEG
ncbi:unnamed protein product [Cochlearia groenlandica]